METVAEPAEISSTLVCCGLSVVWIEYLNEVIWPAMSTW